MQIIIIRTQWVNDDHKDQNVVKHLSHLHVVVPADNASKMSFLCVNYITQTVCYGNYHDENARLQNWNFRHSTERLNCTSPLVYLVYQVLHETSF